MPISEYLGYGSISGQIGTRWRKDEVYYEDDFHTKAGPDPGLFFKGERIIVQEGQSVVLCEVLVLRERVCPAHVYTRSFFRLELQPQKNKASVSSVWSSPTDLHQQSQPPRLH